MTSAIPHLALPGSSHPNSPTAYEPAAWELEYEFHRYLQSISDEELTSRHVSILRNMRALTSTDRDLIPISSFLSSWYWFRKEHQTRYEIHKRSIAYEMDTLRFVSTNMPTDQTMHIRPDHPNACNILYRYTEPKYAEKLLTEGNLLLKSASQMAQHDPLGSRFDLEVQKSKYTASQYVKLRTIDGTEIPIIGNLQHTTSLPDYYLFCLSTDFDLELVHEFGGACVIIKDPEEFRSRMLQWAQQHLPSFRTDGFPVTYYDPFENEHEYMDAALFKKIEYAFQREFRFIFSDRSGKNAHGSIEVKIGNIEDIAEIYCPSK